jgi:hypothetical protein
VADISNRRERIADEKEFNRALLRDASGWAYYYYLSAETQ